VLLAILEDQVTATSSPTTTHACVAGTSATNNYKEGKNVEISENAY
jgi:hypothetical protein